MGKSSVKRTFILSVLLLLLILAFFVARGPYLSNQLKKLILPELSAATGRQVTAQRIYINLFPLFLEARELRVIDQGNEVVHVPMVKGYIEISGLLKKELVLRRIIIRKPSVKSDEPQMADIIRKVKEYLEKERKSPIKVIVKAIVVNEGKVAFVSRDMSLSGEGVNGDVVLDRPQKSPPSRTSIPRISFGAKSLSAQIKGWPELKGEIKGILAVKDDLMEVKGLQVGFYGSMVYASGNYREGAGDLKIRLSLLAESFKKIFHLTQRGEGEINAHGTIHLTSKAPLDSTVDLEIKGIFYLQTLMELLDVKERIEGPVTFTGKLKGPLNHPTGTATAELKKGNLFNIELDELTCAIAYGDGMLYFNGGRASLSHGRAEADATLRISGPEHYSVHVKASDIDSPAVFRFIGWDPGIPLGKMRGEFATVGAGFNPSGWFEYESTAEGKDVLGRVKKAKGSFNLHDDVLTLTDSEVRTPKTVFTANGDINIAASSLSLKTEMKTTDVTDLTLPYQDSVTGSGSASGTITGPIQDPLIRGKAMLRSAAFHGYSLGDVAATTEYRKDLLELKELSAADGAYSAGSRTATLKGAIRFTGARGLFDFKEPRYSLQVSLKNGDLQRLTQVFYKKSLDYRPTGKVDADFSITGKGPTPLYEGSLSIGDIKVGDIPLDSLKAVFSYDDQNLAIKDVVVRKGDSWLTADGSVSHDERFSFRATGNGVSLRDVAGKVVPLEAYLTFRAEGKGSLDAPEVDLSGSFQGGKIKEVTVGDGSIKASLRGRTFLMDASLFNDKVILSGKADLAGNFPWKAQLDVRSGRYDFLIGAFLKEIPEDLLVSMRGHADMSGDRSHFSATAVVNQLSATLFGYSFSNDSEIRVEVKDRKVVFPDISMRGESTFFKVRGSMEIHKWFDFMMEGSSGLAPLKGFSKKIETIKGEAAFSVSVKGAWDNPKINGGLTISDGLLGVKGTAYRVSSMNGQFTMNEDKIVIEKLTGKVGSGDLSISGVAYIEALKIKRFYIDGAVNNVRLETSKDFPVNVSGTLLYKGTMDSQTLSGDIKINHAVYRERVDWQSWLLKAKTRERPRGEIGVFEKVGLNVRIQGADNVRVDNNIARASLKLDLLLRGTIAQPLIFGRVEMMTGTVYFRNNEFRILGASADFSDPKRVNPVMNILAETSIQGYTIRLNLEGQFDHFNLSLSSNPSLEETEILSLLTVGTLQKEPKGIQSGLGVSAATSFLSGQFQDVAQERLKSITGIDRINVEQYTSKVTGKTEPRVSASKRLGDKLTVTYSTSFGTVAAEVIKIEYDVTRSLSLIGERDESGGLGGGIKFRFGFK